MVDNPLSADGQSPSPLLHAWESHVDQGSWARCEAGMSRWLCAVWAGELSGALLCAAPAPVVSDSDLTASSSLRAWLQRTMGRRQHASAQCPGVVITVTPAGCELACPTVDADGGVLLGPQQIQLLSLLGWSHDADVCRFPIARTPRHSGGDGTAGETAAGASGDEELAERCAAMLTRVLIEVLRLPHPADLGVFA